MNVDLTNCDREPIHIPGKIQSHGFLFVINQDNIIVYHSDNITLFVPDISPNLLGKHINTIEPIIGKNEPPNFISQLLSFGKVKGFDQTNPFNTEIRGVAFHLIISVSADFYLLEFEPAHSDSATDVQKMIGRSIAEMLADKNLQNLLSNSAVQVKKVIGYDRVMVYRFAEDGHGEVISEAKNDELPAWLGLHFPASDIPKQARELYKLNLTRLIANVHTEPSAILTIADNEVPLDMTNSGLRAVSPIHIQYLKNMGVESSFSISLMYKGELWGLIACHNYSPRFIDYRSRESAKLIGQILSSALEFRQDEENQHTQALFKSAVAQLSRLMLKDTNINHALTAHSVNLLNAVDAPGAALIFENHIHTLGITPTDLQITSVVAWLKNNVSDNFYYTNQLPVEFPESALFKNVASGIIVTTLSRELGEYVIWFKPEQLETITWAGTPDKPVEITVDGVAQLSPRHSFEAWSQTVSGTSKNWTNEEVKSVMRLRSEITYAINQKAGAIRLLNEKLKEAYEELDTFSFTISHDLKNPISTVKSYAQILLRDKGMNPQSIKILERINKGADKMNNMINEVLDYSRIGRLELTLSDIDPKPIIQDIVRDLLLIYDFDESCITIGKTPRIQCDPVMLSQVFSNIISNAIKYSMQSNPPKVTISGTENNHEVVYSITDNGFGIDIKQLPKIFELFHRTDNVGDIEGSGVGLAIVKRIIEKHKGKVWVDSELGNGSTFNILFNKQ
ncbi:MULTISPECIES: ATP-binding protein [unclassified Mucilaginibacter]|uniref:ATP-binding protein n=1 Tax=unclassified Mucilaginibacter TaxID=2617802 RepID=UPI002AC9DCEC|nr:MULTISPECIES: ATP-binding protein [unclassified Mucilaginibacter]MEB0263356.1 ATP-binding protein [Mucilaginibacter sp. 10I4]MEB0279686.1 ATP-binding protein [Mucilaginibacter sp. 10B2]MEB0302536.1 ATP-binding protein [Mucilaginibacter sp. 5C4]WPX23754.1 ATP-binding protein [Mucilaginibacter sp. 5C4]